ncbi:uncharacterized protein [Physeter macrocephalus]|uniref:Izumo sperm-egg fusion protein 4 n=1 Tax=Physeter macrocephalus TaxID=9755 RepID=A0A9W2WIW8_PHYMC|nr:uncharacterized protein LOC114485083 [Physeter catodon]
MKRASGLVQPGVRTQKGQKRGRRATPCGGPFSSSGRQQEALKDKSHPSLLPPRNGSLEASESCGRPPPCFAPSQAGAHLSGQRTGPEPWAAWEGERAGDRPGLLRRRRLCSCPPTGRIDCQRHCGIFQYETISCTNCTDSHVVCFGYNCKSSAEWETAVQGLLQHINNWSKQDTNASLISPSFRCLEPPHLANLTLENASECLMQH